MPDDAKPTILERVERMARWFRRGLVVAPRVEVEDNDRDLIEARHAVRRLAEAVRSTRSLRPYEASIDVRVRNPEGDDHTLRFPIHQGLLEDYAGMGEDGMKRLISDVLAPYLVPRSSEDLSRVFLSATAHPLEEQHAIEVRAVVAREEFDRLAERYGVPAGTAVLEAMRSLIQERTEKPYAYGPGFVEHGLEQERDRWRKKAERLEVRLRDAYQELHELREKPVTHEVEELAAALEQAGGRIRFFEQEIERQDEHNEELLQRNVWLSERLAEVDPLYRARVEERRRGGG